MLVEDMVNTLEESKIQLEKALKEQKKMAIAYVTAENLYRKELAKQIEILREQKMAATLIIDTARGHLADIRLDRDLKKIEYDSAKDYIRNLQQQLDIYRTLISLEKAKMNLV